MDVRLVARERELAQLVDAVRRGAGAVVTGEAGVGKTLLANAVAAEVRGSGREAGGDRRPSPGTRREAVVWVLATAASRPMPFGALAVLLTDDVTSLHPALV